MNQSELDKYEDKVREVKSDRVRVNMTSPFCDFVYYPSKHTPGLMLAMRVCKPAKPGYIKIGTHGWHMSIKKFEPLEEPASVYLTVDVDMRGRAFSDGNPDCNGFELFDVIDALEYVKVAYADYILDPDVVYFSAGSGGGGNAYAIATKFPDTFAAVIALCGISDYALWYRHDTVGEFRDEMDVWIGDPSDTEAYASRSGITAVGNLLSPLAIVHGNTDLRVPVEQARAFVAKAKEVGKGDLVSYLELDGVGTRDHYGNINDAQRKEMHTFTNTHLSSHRTPITLPRRGTLTVAGYVVTKAFSVVLRNQNRVATLHYDLDTGSFSLPGLGADEYTLTMTE